MNGWYNNRPGHLFLGTCSRKQTCFIAVGRLRL